MDYINIPRPLIYNIRTDLKDFGVQIPGTMNNQLFSNLKEIFMATDKAKELILRCFNNAYYICTIIPFVDFPETEVAEYEKLLLKENSYDCEEVCAVSMAMVCKLLPACDARWRQANNELITNIYYRFTHYRWMHSGAGKSFIRMFANDNTKRFILSKDEFAPRDIIEAIENVGEYPLALGAEFICERLALLNDPKKRMYGADFAIARLKDHVKEMGDIRNLDTTERNYVNTLCEGIEYYEKHYPSQKKDESERNKPPYEKTTNGDQEITWKEKKMRFKDAVFHVMEVKDANGEYLFIRNRQWMAVYRFAIDYDILYDKDDPRKPEDPSSAQYKMFEILAQEQGLDDEKTIRIPFKRDYIEDISKDTYERYRKTYPWSLDGLKHLESFAFFEAMNEVYKELREEYNNKHIQA